MMIRWIQIFLLFFTFSLEASLEKLNGRVIRDLELMGTPENWVPKRGGILDVAIIGAGMSGICTAFALQQVGIDNIALFDQREEGFEGPWLSEAHMKVLKSDKFSTGPCLGIPSLTFQAYYEAKYGVSKWRALERATPEEWMSYLNWYREVLSLPVKNCFQLIHIEVTEDSDFRLIFQTADGKESFLAKKIVFATGRGGAGGAEIPFYVKSLPKKYWSHTAETINYKNLSGRRVAVIGCGAAGFDAAAEALEAGAYSVDILLRRKEVAKENKFDHFASAGYEQGFHKLSDEWRWKFITYAIENGIPPPEEALERVSIFDNFSLRSETFISAITNDGDNLIFKTNRGMIVYDYLILATGYRVEISLQPELSRFASSILLWEDVLECDGNKLGKFPYLGDHYQFLEKVPGSTPCFRHLYCFNYGALLSHGLTSSSIDAISTGARRLAEGIAADFFVENAATFFTDLISPP